MNLKDKINYLIQENNMTKKEFADKLLNLEPKLLRTGKPPSESTIYGYLNGGREIKVELIPYIAEVLNIKEQELFEYDLEYISNYNIKYSKEIREIVHLLQYAPQNAINDIKEYLLKYKTIYEKGIK